jgi:hypothetical chaperone protein
MPGFGYRTWTADGKRELPSRHYHDLATWQFINRLYTGNVINELKQIRREAERRDLVDRFIALVEARGGHALALSVERAKIELTASKTASIEPPPAAGGPPMTVDRAAFDAAIGQATQRVTGAVRGLLASAGLAPEAVERIFITGGSSSVPSLRAGITGLFPAAGVVTGDLFGSVGVGLALDARRKFA